MSYVSPYIILGDCENFVKKVCYPSILRMNHKCQRVKDIILRTTRKHFDMNARQNSQAGLVSFKLDTHNVIILLGMQ